MMHDELANVSDSFSFIEKLLLEILLEVKAQEGGVEGGGGLSRFLMLAARWKCWSTILKILAVEVDIL